MGSNNYLKIIRGGVIKEGEAGGGIKSILKENVVSLSPCILWKKVYIILVTIEKLYKLIFFYITEITIYGN